GDIAWKSLRQAGNVLEQGDHLMRTAFLALAALSSLVMSIHAADSTITVHKRGRIEASPGKWAVKETAEAWQPGQTAMIVCDMWDSHHCLNAVRRCVEMAPRMNEVLSKARGQGVLIVHAPSSCMEAYKDQPGRKLVQSAPKAANLPKDISEWC